MCVKFEHKEHLLSLFTTVRTEKNSKELYATKANFLELLIKKLYCTNRNISRSLSHFIKANRMTSFTHLAATSSDVQKTRTPVHLRRSFSHLSLLILSSLPILGFVPLSLFLSPLVSPYPALKKVRRTYIRAGPAAFRLQHSDERMIRVLSISHYFSP